jgi:hypothetical protein
MPCAAQSMRSCSVAPWSAAGLGVAVTACMRVQLRLAHSGQFGTYYRSKESTLQTGYSY